jgi:hypothetical protein
MDDIKGMNLDNMTYEDFKKRVQQDPFGVALGANIVTLKEAMQSPFIFVVAVNPSDGSFQFAVKSDKEHLSDSILKHFGKLWNETIVPEVREKEPRVVIDDRPLIVIPGKGGGR